VRAHLPRSPHPQGSGCHVPIPPGSMGTGKFAESGAQLRLLAPPPRFCAGGPQPCALLPHSEFLLRQFSFPLPPLACRKQDGDGE